MKVSAFTRPCGLCAILFLAATPAFAQDSAPVARSVPADSSPAAGVLHGRALAERRGTGGRFAGGFMSGLVLGLIGTGITYAIAGSDDTSLPAMDAANLTTANPTYSLAYQQGYSERLKSRRRSSALTGGLLGTLTFVVIYVSATSGN